MTALQRIKPYEAKKALTTLLHQVAYGRKPVILESRGHELAALISMEHFRMFQDLLAQREDDEDWTEAEAALAESKGERIAWEDLKRELNLPDRVSPARTKAAGKAGAKRAGPANAGRQRARR